MSEIKVYTFRTWTLRSAYSKNIEVHVPPGIYNLKEIPNPRGHEAPWWIIPEFNAGMTIESWKQWGECDDYTPFRMRFFNDPV